jgi:hypothetical protein
VLDGFDEPLKESAQGKRGYNFAIPGRLPSQAAPAIHRRQVKAGQNP